MKKMLVEVIVALAVLVGAVLLLHATSGCAVSTQVCQRIGEAGAQADLVVSRLPLEALEDESLYESTEELLYSLSEAHGYCYDDSGKAGE